MIATPLLFNWPIELWVIILISILGICFLAGVVCSIILGKEVAKKITELEEKVKNFRLLLSRPDDQEACEKTGNLK
jgi:hypothetical protein